MSKSAVVAVVIAVIVVGAGGILLAAHNSSNDQTSDTSMTNMDTNKNSSSSETTNKATNSVTIEGFAFSPANITVKKGTTVTWTNKDSTGHTVSADAAQAGSPNPDSKVLSTGETFQATYNSVGTFKYHCSIHPSMTGTVTVTE